MWVKPGSIRFVDQLLNPGDQVAQEVGDSECPPAGWLFAWATRVDATQVLQVNLDVSGPGPLALDGQLCRFNPGRVGQLYVPWPKVNISVSTDGAFAGQARWRLNAMPVHQASEAAGYPMCVDLSEPLDIASLAEQTIVFQDGATSWSLWSDENTTVEVEPQDGNLATVGRWQIGGGAAAGVTVGESTTQPWRRTFRNGRVRLLNTGGADLLGTFFQRFDWKTWGDSA